MPNSTHRGITHETNMASSSHDAGGLCLGRGANSGLRRFWHGRQQHQYRRGHNRERNRHNGFTKYASRRDSRNTERYRRNHSGQHSGSVDYNDSRYHFHESEWSRNNAEHDRKLGSS